MGVENRAAASARPSGSWRFNGATPRWAWKTGHEVHRPGQRFELQWGHATMGVENLAPTVGSVTVQTCFNGATPRWAWKTARPAVRNRQPLAASMGPRHDGRGKPGGPPVLYRRTIHSFNGATPRWAWKTEPPRGGSGANFEGFNGATPRWAWKTGCGPDSS